MLGGRQCAGLVLAEPAVAVAGQPAIRRVAQAARHQCQRVRQPPATAQSGKKLDSRVVNPPPKNTS